jgi:hypothetical protein
LLLSNLRVELFESAFVDFQAFTNFDGYFDEYTPGLAWLFLWGIGLGFVAIGGALTIFYAPLSARSGTTQLMA